MSFRAGKGSSSKPSGKMYAVRKGRATGLFRTWAECEAQVKGFSGAQFKSFTTEPAAKAYLGLSQGGSEVTSAQKTPVEGFAKTKATLPVTSLGANPIKDQAILSAKVPRFYTGRSGFSTITNSISSSSSSVPSPLTSSSSASRFSGQNKTSNRKTGGGTRGGGARKSSGAKNKGPQMTVEDIKDGSLVVYSDGSCLGNYNVKETKPPAGWGFLVLRWNLSSTHELLHEAFGPVVLDPAKSGYIGAEVFSNNTAELTAIAKAMDYIHDLPVPSTGAEPVIVRYDSEYAAKSVMGLFNGAKNRDLILKCREALARARIVRQVDFIHVRGHSAEQYNDRVDELAKMGAAMCAEERAVGKQTNTASTPGTKRGREASPPRSNTRKKKST
mmetsp:Transcript_15305/g.29674  ORF Transcript_15305/g.29674 Transcript_15305/m.29674 type:complete len:386 (-) Transcript_15305:142-1299(-)